MLKKFHSYYASAGEGCFNQYAWRIKMCSELLEFRLLPEESEGILKLQLSDARFCRVRQCPKANASSLLIRINEHLEIL